MPVPRSLHHLTDLVLRNGLFVAACAVALAWETTLLAGVPSRPVAFYAFVFFATWAAYRLHAVVRSFNSSAPAAWASLVVPFVGATAFLAIGTTPADVPAIATAAVLATFYCVPIRAGLPTLREFGLLKIAVLAGVWTLITGYLPAADAEPTLLGYLCLRRFAFMFALCLAFDVRDARADASLGIRTLPVIVGTPAAYGIMRGTLLVFAVLVLVGPIAVAEPLAMPTTLALLVSAAITWLAIEWTRRPTTTSRFYLGCVDGMMIVQCLLVSMVARMR